ncbi:cation:dicarboxylate symporter family transporter [Thalassotalea sp. PLHSN55]|uniref:cation:dicarboxylate symporter family transporter n=1 Tax=Thalassotalea sp. PLHSN55 TaxID=3435888 RepID=UPI003F874342
MKLSNIPQSVKVLFAMSAGFVFGSFSNSVIFGVDSIANAFVLLLQMTALPYISLSLICGLGGLSVLRAKSSVKQTIAVLVALTSVILFFILLAPIAFPNWSNADFYSASTEQPTPKLDLVSLFIPANPFNAFANAVIPSVVVFSVFVGIGLMLSKNKKYTLLILSTFKMAIANVSSLVMRYVAPIGVFCIAFRAAVTIDPSDVNGLTVYITTAIALVLFLSLAVLPALVTIFTPFSHKQVIEVSREAMVTAFATGSFIVVVPTIVEKLKLMLASLEHPNKDLLKLPNIIVPITFSLPVGGKLLALLFTLFAAWFSGAYISETDYINLIVFGMPQLFGTPIIAMPHLLELFNVSSAMFDFFVLSENLIVSRLNALLSVAFACSAPLLIAVTLTNKVTVNWRRLSINLMVLPLMAIMVFLGLRITFSEISYQYHGYDLFIERDFIYPDIKSTYKKSPAKTASKVQPFSNVLTRVQQRGFLRVGYFRDDLPYSFHNKNGKLVGFDIEIMNQLAKDLGVDIEFVKIYHDQAKPLLASGYLDITSGIPLIPDNMKDFTLTAPYSSQEIAFLVKDERRAEFTHWDKILTRDDLTIGIPETFFYKDAINRIFTKGNAWEMSTPRLLFREQAEQVDGLLYGAAASSAWTLLYPNYTVIAPKPKLPALTMAFPINKNDHAFELFMQNWLSMKKQSGMLDTLFSYWIEGKKVNSTAVPVLTKG